MIINFFTPDIPKRSIEERTAILRKRNSTEPPTDNYKQYGFDYFDNPEMGIGYGGYKYDGRYKAAAEAMVKHYHLQKGDRILEIGCAKGFILVEFLKLGLEVYGIDASEYATENAHPDVAQSIQKGDAANLPFNDSYFALVFGKEVLPHIDERQVETVVRECLRVSKGPVFFEIGCGSSEEGVALMNEWDHTHKCTHTKDWWENLFQNLPQECDRHYKEMF
ncbi:MAG: methyltransferase domain-containing protein [Bdellovibrionales bacterium]|nr:methyltransferase domain-containing protein [Bdellovibrionales bacterium]